MSVRADGICTRGRVICGSSRKRLERLDVLGRATGALPEGKDWLGASVPAGAVALADEWSGVYPRASSGGWQLIGTTDLAMWDAHRESPALLTPGRLVRFTSRASGSSVAAASEGANATGSRGRS